MRRTVSGQQNVGGEFKSQRSGVRFVLIAAAPCFFSENSLSGALERARLARIKKYSLRAL